MTDKIFMILWLIVAIEDILFFSYTWILSVIAFSAHPYLFLVSIVSILWPNIGIGGGDIPFLLYYASTGNIYIKLCTLCAVSLCIQRDGKIPLVAALFVSHILYLNGTIYK